MATDLYKASPNQYQLGSQLGARAGPLTPAPLGPLARAGQNTWGGTFTKTPQPAGTFDVTKVMNPQWARFFDMAAEATGGDFSNPETQQAPQQSPSITTGAGTFPRIQPMAYPNQTRFGAAPGGSTGAPGGSYSAGGIGGGGRGVPSNPGFTPGPLGNMVGNELYNPETGGMQRTGAQKGTNAGQALKALQEASGLDLLGSSSSAGFGAWGGAGDGLGGTAPQVSMPDTSAARNAIFARAKDQAGQTARAALTGLQGEMAGRGLLGSGIEGSEMANIIGQAAGGVNEVTREQAIQDALAAARAGEVGYQGSITQRGQDLTARGQNLSARDADAARRAQSIQGLLSVINSSGMLY